MPTITVSYYRCLSCTQFFRVLAEQRTSCPLCNSGFIEKINDFSSSANLVTTSSTEWVSIHRIYDPSLNQDIVLQIGGDDERAEGGIENSFRDRDAFENFVSESSMESRIGQQLTAIEAFTTRNPLACKSAIESMQRVKISDCHIAVKANCVVCMDDFELETEVRELPCKHIFHEDCITPWLSIRNACPICRFKLPSEPRRISRVGAQGTLESGSNIAASGLELDGRVSRVFDYQSEPRRISSVRAQGTLGSNSNSAVYREDGKPSKCLYVFIFFIFLLALLASLHVI